MNSLGFGIRLMFTLAAAMLITNYLLTWMFLPGCSTTIV